MKRIDILKRLVEIEDNLSAEPENPARIDNAGYFMLDIYDDDKLKEVVELVGQWSYDKRVEERKRLEEEKNSLEKELFSDIKERY